MPATFLSSYRNNLTLLTFILYLTLVIPKPVVQLTTIRTIHRYRSPFIIIQLHHLIKFLAVQIKVLQKQSGIHLM